MPSARRSRSDLPFIFMMSTLAAPLLWGAIYVFFLDLEGQTKVAMAVLAVASSAPLVAVIVWVLLRPLPEIHSASDFSRVHPPTGVQQQKLAPQRTDTRFEFQMPTSPPRSRRSALRRHDRMSGCETGVAGQA